LFFFKVYDNGRPVEGDECNVVWVVDSNQLPFYRAERYHQFHNGIGKAFGRDYTQDLKSAMIQAGEITVLCSLFSTIL
jgi:hypothetical protein